MCIVMKEQGMGEDAGSRQMGFPWGAEVREAGSVSRWVRTGFL